MKLLFLFFVSLLSGCHAGTGGTIGDFIPGTYVKQSESEYSKAYDTLRISVYDPAANTYLLLQHTGYQVIKDGRLQPKQYKNNREIAVYDESTHQLQGMNSGRLLVFSPEHGTVLMGSAEFVKLK
jgi:hypothetical protein